MPGSWRELAIKPLPCMPMPIIPKRSRSLGATVWGIAQIGVGSSTMALVAIVAPAADALREIKSRRETWRLIRDPPVTKTREVYRKRGFVVVESLLEREARSTA